MIAVPANISSWLLFAAVALAPLPFGSNEPTTIAFWCIVLGTCLVFAPVRALGAGQLALAALAVIVVAAYGLVLHEQLAVHPWLSAATPDPIWHEAAAALGEPIQPSVSIARNQPWFELGRPLVCMLALACGFLVGADRGLRHPGAPVRPQPHPVARQGSLPRLRDGNLHQPQYRGGLFRFMRGGVVAFALGAGAASHATGPAGVAGDACEAVLEHAEKGLRPIPLRCSSIRAIRLLATSYRETCKPRPARLGSKFLS